MKRMMTSISLQGRKYPVRMVMGALLDYKRETGEDVSQMDTADLECLLRLMFCCVRAACRADGVDFTMDFAQFCDSVTPADLEAWNRSAAEGPEADGDEKKTARPT